MSNLIGQSLGRYHLLEQLGEGGMAVVYKAYDTRLETDVAVKVIRTERLAPEILQRSLKRFEREAKALARLTHPNIVKVTDFGEYEGKPYLVMEYLPGGTLKNRIKQGPIPWGDAIRLLLPIAEALDFAHSQNMIHRDVKPSNILLTERGQPMLTDFGIAKILDLEETQDLTGTGMGVGTPEYMAPEQWTGKASALSDQYSLGVVLYEMLTGRKPYIADTPAAILLKQATEPLPRPGQYARDLPEKVEKVLLKTLTKNPEDRYQSMEEMASAWQNALESKGQVMPSISGSAKSRQKPRVEAIATQETLGTIDQSDYEEEFVEAQPSRIVEYDGKKELTIAIASGVEMAFVRVPAGEFLMGSPDGIGINDEHPQHEIYLDEFWMSKTPVTNLQYQVFIEATGYLPPDYWKDNRSPDGKKQHPITFVSWTDSNTFCAWASRVSKQKIRLPTEAEWEKAARGTDKLLYPWGSQKPSRDLCNYLKLFSADTSPVEQFSPQGDSPYGCADMAGNVWEWTADWYDSEYYAYSPPKNPSGR